MGQYISEGLFYSQRTLAVLGNNACVVLEPGYDAVVQGKYVGSSVEEVIELSKSLHKDISHIWYSHYHGDHVGNLPFYLKRISDPVFLIGHANSPIPEQYSKVQLIQPDQFLPISRQQELFLDGRIYQFIPTPGHSIYQDDLCVYLRQEKILLVGDMLQPQGTSYEKADGLSPVPYFFNGLSYLDSLAILQDLEFEQVITGHAQRLDKATAHLWIDVTYACVNRIQTLAQMAAQQQPKQVAEVLCEQVYDQIVQERHFDQNIALSRKHSTSPHHKSDYVIYDLPGIRYFVQQALQSR